jgi:hypothetical protein
VGIEGNVPVTNQSAARRPAGRLSVVAGALLVLLGLTLPLAAPAQAGTSFTVDLKVNDRPLVGPALRLDPRHPAKITIKARNTGPSTVRIASVRLTGSALGLTFFAYDTAVGLDVPPGQEVQQSFDVDLADLGGQATGLMPIEVTARDQQRRVIAGNIGTGDITGSLISVFGVFGIFLILATVSSWGAVIYGLARHRLPANRWRRALRFLPAGVGTGLVLVISLAVLRVTPPVASLEIPLVLASAGVGFLLGYLTPSPDHDPAPPRPVDSAGPPPPPGSSFERPAGSPLAAVGFDTAPLPGDK